MDIEKNSFEELEGKLITNPEIDESEIPFNIKKTFSKV